MQEINHLITNAGNRYMKLDLSKPIKALNKAYLKEKVSRNHIELFKKNLQQLLSRINEQESEEHLKNVIADFLKDKQKIKISAHRLQYSNQKKFLT